MLNAKGVQGAQALLQGPGSVDSLKGPIVTYFDNARAHAKVIGGRVARANVDIWWRRPAHIDQLDPS